MEIKEFLQGIVDAKQKRADELRKKVKESQDVNEVRSLGDALRAVTEEIRQAKEQLNEMEGDPEGDGAQQQGAAQEGRSQASGTLNPLATYQMQGQEKKEGRSDDIFDTPEYQTAFMNFACRNVPIPAELVQRADAVTATTDVGAVIPTTILNEIIKKLESYGSIYAKVRKLNIQGGVSVPILSLKPTATWIGETKTSDKQKLSMNDSISFSYFGLECKISQSLLTSATTLPMFQQLFVPLATEAIMKALEIAIFNGTGSNQMLGICVDSRVPAKNKITLTDAEIGKWGVWKKKVFGSMPKAYRNGEFFMAQSTFDGYIDGMVDSTGQPIGRVNYGIEGAERYRFGGKTVETVEDDIIKPFETASTGDVIAVFAKMSDYAINSNMQMRVVKWEDHDNNEIKNKCILICDGKLLDPNGVIIIKKGNASE